MPKLTDSSKKGATPGKLALIGVLAVVLVVVLAVQFGGSLGAGQPRDDDPGRESRGPGLAGQNAAQSPQPTERGGNGQDASRPWPKLELADVSAYDPFAAGTPAVEPTKSLAITRQIEADHAQQDQLLEQLREKGVQAVIGGSRNGNAAVIGSETVRVGDVVAGFRVVGIEADGVLLERSPAD